MATAADPTATKPANPVITSFPFNPLTTTFTRPSDCNGIYASTFLSGVDFSTSCLPSGFHTEASSYFSPGLICPSGYYSACHDNIGKAEITTVTCCPTVATDVSLSCVTASTLRSVWSTLFCTWIAPPGDGTSLPITLSQNGVTSTVRAGFTSPGGLNAYGIRMVYQSTDLATTTTGSLTTTTATTTGGSNPTHTDNSESSGSSGLSTGATIAIGVVVPVVVLGLLAGLFIWWRRRQHYKRVRMDPSPPPPPELHGNQIVPPSELQGAMTPQKPYYPVELPANQ